MQCALTLSGVLLLHEKKNYLKRVELGVRINQTKHIFVCFLGALCAECLVSNVNITFFYSLVTLNGCLRACECPLQALQHCTVTKVVFFS